ncbi:MULTISPECIES: O-antigen ligase family protein [Caloramator]|uniref:O-antigen ligase like membrane protein n=1 Tax=Caloramator proteoclasticus DSM 10124 TaxID=1121262 RepID=A0A1M4YE92_9CLOT|nr:MULTISPECIES: O-antigen ligase family protein [Caloramator]SHF03913.1 O-antigen ligase like membrane protein [Caloramator proteoclasticus DSM 10124]
MFNTNKDKMLRIFLIAVLLNPMLDLLTGVYLKTFNLDPRFTPGIIVRNLFLLYMIYYIYKNKINISYYIILMLTFMITIVVQHFSGININLFKEIQYYLKFLYNISILLIGLEVFKNLRRAEINKFIYYLTLSAFIYSIIVVMSFIFGVGYKTYSYSNLSKGFFYAGNDLTAIVAVVYPLSLYLILSDNNYKKDLVIYNLIIMLALTVIGTRVALLSILFSFLVFISFTFLIKNINLLKRFITIMLLSVVVFVLFSQAVKFYKNTNIIGSTIERQEAIKERTNNEMYSYVLNSRNDKFNSAFDEYKNTNILRKLFGLSRSSKMENIEMDFVDVWLFYGIVGFIIMMYSIIKNGVLFILSSFAYRKDLLYISMFVSLFIGFGSSFLAGHVLFSASAGIFSFLILALSNCIFKDGYGLKR